MPFHLLTVAVICVVWCVGLLLELYLKPGKQHSRADSFRLTAICSGSGASNRLSLLATLQELGWHSIVLAHCLSRTGHSSDSAAVSA